jgi:hypothetical protein
MRRSTRIALLAALMAIAMVLGTSAAFGVWGGELDGDAHPSVGAMYFDEGGPLTVETLICSGSYAGPSTDGQHDVFLTAGHCLPPADLGLPPFLLKVSFDNNGSDEFPDTPITVEEYHQMPGFGHDRGDLHDLGVLLLPAGSVQDDFPTAAANAVQLPTENYMNDLKRARELKRRTAEIVGYGVTPVWGPGGPTTFEFDGVRRSGESVINGLTKSAVLYNQNPNGIGTGAGLCFGDSGSPQLDEGTLNVLSVTSGGNGQCNSVNNNYRVDTPQAREFLGNFLDLP